MSKSEKQTRISKKYSSFFLSKATLVALLILFSAAAPYKATAANGSQNKIHAEQTIAARKARLEQQAEQLRKFKEFQSLNVQLSEINFKKLFSRTKNIIGIEFILAAPSSQSFQSFWGHVLIRFVDDDPFMFNDLVLSLAFDLDEPFLSPRKVMFGGYPVVAEMHTLGVFMKQYVQGEGRYFERWPLYMSNEEIGRFINVLEKRIASPEKFGSYYFVGRNCASVVARLLDEAGLPDTKHLMPAQTPESLQRYLKFRKLSQLPPINGAAIGWVAEQLSKKFNLKLEDIRRGILPIETFEYFKALDYSALAQFFLFYPLNNSPELYKILVEHIKERREKGARVEWGLERLPDILYKPCSDKDCLNEQIAVARKLWGTGFDKFYLRQNQEVYLYDDMTYKDASAMRTPQDWSFKYGMEFVAHGR